MRTPDELLGLLGMEADPSRKRPLVICCDFDGTVTVDDLCVATLKTFGKPEWLEWEERWLRGEISSRENLLRQFETVEADPTELHSFYHSAELSPGFQELVAWSRERETPFLLLSDGLDIYIQDVLQRHGLRDLPFVANHAEIVESRFIITFPHSAASCGRCGTCKASFIRTLRTQFDRIVYMGDGLSDRCPAMLADTIYAKDKLAEICSRAGRTFTPFQDFRTILTDLAEDPRV